MDLEERVSADSGRNTLVKRDKRMPEGVSGADGGKSVANGFSARAAALVQARNN